MLLIIADNYFCHGVESRGKWLHLGGRSIVEVTNVKFCMFGMVENIALLHFSGVTWTPDDWD